MDKNIAVVGCGGWGKNLVRNFAELGALHSICDNSPEVLKRFQSLSPAIKRESDYDSVLKDPEIKGVVLASPAALHYKMAKAALEANKDVFVEKPLSLSVPNGEELIKIAKEKNRILMVGHLLEYHPAIVKLKEMVDSGKLGKIEYIYSNRLNLGKFRTEENILWSFAPHDISAILLLLNKIPVSVASHGGYYLHENIADVTTSTMSFSDGVKSHVFVSWLHPYKEQKLVVVGHKAMAVFDDTATTNKLQLYEHDIEWIEQTPVPHGQPSKTIEFPATEPLVLECQHFIDCIKSRQSPRTNGVSALRVLRVLDACQRSLNSHGAVITLEPVTKDYFVHETALVENPSQIGKGTKIWHFCHVMPGAKIGSNCVIGQNGYIASTATIGNGVKIENNISVFDGVTLEDDVFCGPSCVFTNVNKPRSAINQKGNYGKTIVKKGATIGANSTIVCGHNLGNYAFVGAGSVVTFNVPDYAIVYGNPARIRGWVCQCGSALDFSKNKHAKCGVCGKEYDQKSENEVIFCEHGGK
jgi:UDP-2-acetamido-3-amino-2,3-dideoxy-glucuronate N-acetyltransferase